MTYTIKNKIESLNFSYVGDNFKDWFYGMPFDKKAKVKNLIPTKLPRSMNDFEIQKELKPTEVRMEELVETLETMSHDIWAIFYVKDKDGVLRSVDVCRCGGGWRARAVALGGYGWRDNGQVFSRNSCPPEPLSPDTLSPGLLDRLEKLEAFQRKVEDVLKLK